MCTESNNLLRIAVDGVRSSNEPCTVCLFKAKRNMDKEMDLKPNIELIRLKKYYGIPRGYEHDPFYSLNIRNMVYQTFTVYFW